MIEKVMGSDDREALLKGPEYEDIDIDGANDALPLRDRSTTLYDSERPNADYPQWLPEAHTQFRSFARKRRRISNVLSIIAITIMTIAIIGISGPFVKHFVKEDSIYLLSPTSRGHSSSQQVRASWTLRGKLATGTNRTIITINNHFAGPTIEAWQGDSVTVVVKNELSQATSIHWHGVSQTDDNKQDGVPYVTQDPIQSGETMIYSFTADSAGTFWWHAHSQTSRLDGLFGALIVHPRTPSNAHYLQALKDNYTDFVILVGDWYEQDTGQLLAEYLDAENTALIEPIPKSIMINGVLSSDTGFTKFPLPKLKRVTRYWRLRVINVGALAEIRAMAPNKTDGFVIIEADASWTKPVKVNSLTLSPGQRYSLILDADDYSPGEEIELEFSLEMRSHHHTSPPSQGSYTHVSHEHEHHHHHHHHRRRRRRRRRGIESEKSIDSPIHLHVGMLHPPFSSTNLSSVHTTAHPALLVPDLTRLTLGMRDVNGHTRSTINGRAYQSTNHTLLDEYPQISAQNVSGLSTKYSSSILTLSIKHGESMLILFRNHGGGNHPMHIHGHKMMVLATDSFYFDPVTQNRVSRPFDEHGIPSLYRAAHSGRALERAVERDTVNVAEDGWTLVSIKGQGRGLWSLHCHSAWHEMSGMAMILEVR